MKITFLGTGAGLPSKQRNVSSVALHLLEDQGAIWLFDCGEATQHQILHTTLKPRKIQKIFVTHLHGDHIYGLPGLLSSRSFQEGTSPLTIYGPKGLDQFIETSLSISQTNLQYPIHFIEIFDGFQLVEGDYTIDVVQLDHGIDSFGYRMIEQDQVGELKVDKLIDLGIKPGPIYQQIKQNEATELPDGRIIERKDVVGSDKKGRKLAIFGDTRYPLKFKEFVKDIDLLIHEATFDRTDQDLADQYYHSSNVEVAQLARLANIKQLVLTHISARYQNHDLAEFIDEAKAIFQPTLIAKDLLTIEIPIATR